MIEIRELPAPDELYDCAQTLPSSWLQIDRVGAYHQANKLLLLPTVGVGICFLYPASDWHHLTLVTRSALPRPGELHPYVRYWQPSRVTHLEDNSGVVFEVSVKPEWDTPESHEAAHPQPYEEPFEFSDDEGWARLKAALRVADSVG